MSVWGHDEGAVRQAVETVEAGISITGRVSDVDWDPSAMTIEELTAPPPPPL